MSCEGPVGRYAIYRLSDGMVINVIMAYPTCNAPEDHGIVATGEDIPCGIGWTYDGTGFIAPPDPPEEDAPPSEGA